MNVLLLIIGITLYLGAIVIGRRVRRTMERRGWDYESEGETWVTTITVWWI